jgi:hypothetical protein
LCPVTRLRGAENSPLPPFPSVHPPQSRSRSRDSYYSSDSGGEEERENRPPRPSSSSHQLGGPKASPRAPRDGGADKPRDRDRDRGRFGRGGRQEDGEATLAALKEMLQTLHGINEAMPDHQGFLPEELAARVNCPDPALWQEVYTGARIRPNKSNRLYRSRVLYLISYLERRLGLPLSRPPFPRRSSGQPSDRGTDRRFGDRGNDNDRIHQGRERGARHSYPPAGASSAFSSSSRRDGARDAGRERGEASTEEVEEQMESAEPTPFLAIHHLPRYPSVQFSSDKGLDRFLLLLLYYLTPFLPESGRVHLLFGFLPQDNRRRLMGNRKG